MTDPRQDWAKDNRGNIDRALVESLKPTDADRAQVGAALTWAREIAPNTDSDYLHNLRVVCSGESVDLRGMGLLCSTLAAHGRAMGQVREAADKAARKPSEWVGAVKQRLTLTLTCERIIDCEGAYGVTHLHLFTDEQGNNLSWFASASRLTEGRTYSVKAHVKAHEECRGEKQTMLSRCKCEEVAQS